jgi:hypothetical protein
MFRTAHAWARFPQSRVRSEAARACMLQSSSATCPVLLSPQLLSPGYLGRHADAISPFNIKPAATTAVPETLTRGSTTGQRDKNRPSSIVICLRSIIRLIPVCPATSWRELVHKNSVALGISTHHVRHSLRPALAGLGPATRWMRRPRTALAPIRLRIPATASVLLSNRL